MFSIETHTCIVFMQMLARSKLKDYENTGSKHYLNNRLIWGRNPQYVSLNLIWLLRFNTMDQPRGYIGFTVQRSQITRWAIWGEALCIWMSSPCNTCVADWRLIGVLGKIIFADNEICLQVEVVPDMLLSTK